MTATGSDTREKIIHKGAQLIHAQGYKATGLQQILDVAGIPKGSFYFYFKSKDDFGCAVIDYFTRTIGEIFTGLLRDARITPLERLNKLLDYYESAFKKSGATLGCPIGNLSLELADANEELRKHLQVAIEGFITEIELCLEEAKKSRQLPVGLNTADTARFIFHGLEGAILHMKVAKSIEPVRTFRRYLNTYLKGNHQTHA
jgi:TetR/AcrR family transcriptional regulator, transcriptional repressor for nem operon